MSASKKPRVAIVDDEPEKLGLLRDELKESVTLTVSRPPDVTEDILQSSDLVLVDLRLEDWPERDNTEWIAQQPRDGLALASVLRSHCNYEKEGSPTAFAIYSAHLRDLCDDILVNKREHSIARLNNVEWVFPKTHPTYAVPLATQICSLASAVARLPSEWAADTFDAIEQQVNELLALRKRASWYNSAWEDIRACHPPLHELSHWNHGLAVLRWLLHRILPYPCFLYDEMWLACRLRVSVESVRAELETESQLAQNLNKARYVGILSDFVGPRWWRAGIEQFVWEQTKGNPFDLDHLSQALRRLAATDVALLEFLQPVVCIDADYAPADIHSIDDAVRLQPDDWPPYADQAWALITDVEQAEVLKAIVLDQDRRRLQRDEPT